jgi:hypothetical protein
VPRWNARGAESPLPLGSTPFTTVTAGSVTDPKIPAAVGDSWAHAHEYPVTTVTIAALGPKLPPYSGDSWRLAAASMLGAVPLAVASAALAGASVAGRPSGLPPRPAPVVVSVQHGVTVVAGALARPKWPLEFGD